MKHWKPFGWTLFFRKWFKESKAWMGEKEKAGAFLFFKLIETLTAGHYEHPAVSLHVARFYLLASTIIIPHSSTPPAPLITLTLHSFGQLWVVTVTAIFFHFSEFDVHCGRWRGHEDRGFPGKLLFKAFIIAYKTQLSLLTLHSPFHSHRSFFPSLLLPLLQCPECLVSWDCLWVLCWWG